MTRALLKGVAYSVRAALDVMQAIAPINELVATGGARSALWLQIITDVLGINLAKPIFAEGAAYGAALSLPSQSIVCGDVLESANT